MRRLIVVIREELPGDAEQFATVIREAFSSHPHSRQTAPLIVAALRRADVLCVSIVAEVSGETVGQIALYQVTISDGSTDWYGLGPVSVTPTHQGEGLDSELVTRGLDELRKRAARGCMVLGEPALYGRF